jgi:hypothetical protein
MPSSEDIENLALALGEQRYAVWKGCGPHDLQQLPLTHSGERYCPNCYSIWTSDGVILNGPTRAEG